MANNIMVAFSKWAYSSYLLKTTFSQRFLNMCHEQKTNNN